MCPHRLIITLHSTQTQRLIQVQASRKQAVCVQAHPSSLLKPLTPTLRDSTACLGPQMVHRPKALAVFLLVCFRYLFRRSQESCWSIFSYGSLKRLVLLTGEGAKGKSRPSAKIFSYGLLPEGAPLPHHTQSGWAFPISMKATLDTSSGKTSYSGDSNLQQIDNKNNYNSILTIHRQTFQYKEYCQPTHVRRCRERQAQVSSFLPDMVLPSFERVILVHSTSISSSRK